jgi:hypothetical protein
MDDIAASKAKTARRSGAITLEQARKLMEVWYEKTRKD